MPYVKQAVRDRLDYKIGALIEELRTYDETEIDGALTYSLCRLVAQTLKPSKAVGGWRYGYLNRAMGVLICVQQEFYRRVVAPYEDAQMVKNTDIQW